jgi:hypothetical protein
MLERSLILLKKYELTCYFVFSMRDLEWCQYFRGNVQDTG